MQIRISAGEVVVDDAADLTRLAVLRHEPADVATELRRAGLGELSPDGDALLPVAALRERARAALADGTDPAEWDRGWTAMIEYARRKGWLSSDGTHVQAHVETA